MSQRKARIRRWLAELIYPREKRERTAASEEWLARKEAARRQYHRIWSQAHDSPDYVKNEWGEMYRRLADLGLEL